MAETDENLILFLIAVQTQAALLLHGTESPSSFYFIALPSLKCGFLSQFKTEALALAIMSVLLSAGRGEMKSEGFFLSIQGLLQKLYIISAHIQLAQS